MKQAAMNLIKYFWWLKRLIYLWVKSKSFPDNANDLSISPDKPVCYVLKTNFLTDILVLDHHCKKMGLPRPLLKPMELTSAGQGAYIYLVKKGFFQLRRSNQAPTYLQELIKKVIEEKKDIQIVPVSIFWGRNPGKEEKSLFKLLFFDDENGGMLQRFFTFFAHGRSVVCNFGKPISIMEQTADNLSPIDLAKKIRRVMRVHFRKQREAILGPYIYDHAQVIKSILGSKYMRVAIQKDASKKGGSLAKSQARAKKYTEEIAAKQSHNVIRFFDILLTWIWRKMYDGVEIYNREELRELAQNHEIVYVPCHRSHMDYLLLGYTLYYIGLMPPHTAAGINLNFWPAGSLLRRAGAFFIRRTFAGNRLYGAVFNEYVHYLLTHGYPLSFYPEGGRSRTGFMLKPKVGMYSMIVQSMQRFSNKPIALIPIYIGYDKLMEGRSYSKELGGRAKQRESVGQLVKARKILKKDFGKAYLNLGEPLFLNDYLDQHKPGWKNIPDDDGKIAKELAPTIEQLGKEITIRANASAVLTPVGLFTTIILATPKHALGEEDLLGCAKLLINILNKKPYSEQMKNIDGELKGKLAYAEKLAQIGRFSHPSGDVIYIDEQIRPLVTYYRNNTLHLFALPSLLACFFQYNNSRKINELLDSALHFYHFLASEFFLRWDSSNIKAALAEYLNVLVEFGLLIRNDQTITRPDILSNQFQQLKILGNIIFPFVEKYAIYGALLYRYERGSHINIDHFEEESLRTLQRLSILTGSEANLFEKNAFRYYIEHIKLQGYVKTENNDIWVDKSLTELLEKTSDLLSPDVKQSIIKTSQRDCRQDTLHSLESAALGIQHEQSGIGK